MDMDRSFLIASSLFALVGAAWGMWAVHQGKRSPWTVAWILGAFLCQIGFLSVRGQSRAA
jgi:hypothetical protein